MDGDDEGTGVEDAEKGTGKSAEGRLEMERGMTGMAVVDPVDGMGGAGMVRVIDREKCVHERQCHGW